MWNVLSWVHWFAVAVLVIAAVMLGMCAWRQRDWAVSAPALVFAALAILAAMLAESAHAGVAAAIAVAATGALAFAIAIYRRPMLGVRTKASALARLIPDTFFLLSADGTILDFHPSPGFRLYRPAEEFIGRRVLDVVPAEVAERTMSRMEETLRDGELVEFEYELQIEGERLYFEARLLREDEDTVLAIVREVTERHQIEEALIAAGRRYRALFEEAPVMYVVSENRDDVPYITDCNFLFLRTLGYERREVVGRPLADFYVPASRRELLERGGYRRALAGNFMEEPRTLLTRDGRRVEAQVQSIPQLDADGRAWGTRATYVDMTERLEIDRRQEAFFNQSLDGCFFMMLDEPVRWDDSVDKSAVLQHVFQHQRITEANDAILAQYEARREQFLGLRPIDFFEHDLEHGLDLWRRFFDAGRIRMESRERTMNGNELWIEGEYVCLYDDRGFVTGHFGIQRDVSDRMHVSAAREALITELESRNEELERLAGTVAHQLRTPMVTMLGFLGLLQEDLQQSKTPQAMQDFDNVMRAAVRMRQLADSLQDYSHAGQLAGADQVVALSDLGNEATRLLQAEHGSAVSIVEVTDDMPLVKANRSGLVQALSILIDNALRYMGDQGQPQVRVDARREDGSVLCSVQDNGAGIAAASQERIFGLFQREGEDGTGSGVGLALARRIITAHGGRIWVESAGPGEGSTFLFTLPDLLGEQGQHRQT